MTGHWVIGPKGGVIAADVTGKCPCGGTFSASREPASVLHSLPPCNDFIEKEPDEYLRFVRIKRSD